MNFKELRIKADYTQRRLAQLVNNVHESTVQAWEAGENIPTAENMARLKELLGAEVEAALLEKKDAKGEYL